VHGRHVGGWRVDHRHADRPKLPGEVMKRLADEMDALMKDAKIAMTRTR